MNKNLKFAICCFTFIIILLILLSKLFGFHGRYDSNVSYNPLNWAEFYQLLPTFILVSLVVTVFCTILSAQGEKNEKWHIEQSQKRIAEQEKQEQLEQNEKEVSPYKKLMLYFIPTFRGTYKKEDEKEDEK